MPSTLFINKYVNGNEAIEHIVDNTTTIDAKSPSLPNFTAIIAPLAALGIESRKNIVYLIVVATGKYATRNIVRKDITTSFTAVAIYAHLSVNNCLRLIFANRIPITIIESGVVIFDKKFKLFISLLIIL